MLDIIREAFPQTEANNCLQTLTDSEFFIYDHETAHRCYIQDDPDGAKHFKIENPDGHNIHFLAIDKCLFMDNEVTQRCDCSVFDEQTFCFIEIKTTSSNQGRRISKIRGRAVSQLKATITHFQNNMAFNSIQLEAYVVILVDADLEESELEELQTPPRNRASLTEKIAEFDEIGVSLFYTNVKQFIQNQFDGMLLQSL